MTPNLAVDFSGTGFPMDGRYPDWDRPETIAGAFKIVDRWEDHMGSVVVLDNGENPPKRWALDGPDALAALSREQAACPTCGLRDPGPEHRANEPLLCSDAPAPSRAQSSEAAASGEAQEPRS